MVSTAHRMISPPELTPDSTKYTRDKVKETVTDTTDRASRGFDSKGVDQEDFATPPT
ncbi:Heat shock protein 9/12 [Penicillium paradoxum]|uniref:Heat shock protein 9/12 n=1 Tax=Penicillium paradoxum TaxID=176176 RepID=UPI002547DF4C|nr:Heat shock protein 9/12 [Penicillium paradoxum]KAJ5774541.1 Heat shock protein 9/12 [Penicillium paradoxum]